MRFQVLPSRLAFAILALVALLPLVSSTNVLDLDKSYRLEKREAKKDENVLLSGKVDAGSMEKLGDMKVDHHPSSSADRARREHHSAHEVDQHVVNSEVDAMAAVKESSAAETNALAAAVEAAEAEQALEENSSFEENSAGDLVPAWASRSSGVRLPNPNVPNRHLGATSLGGSIPDVQSPIGRLFDQSTDLARETALMFQIIAKREDYLVGEVERFKQALQSAVEILRESEVKVQMRSKRDRGDTDQCIDVTASDSNGPQPMAGTYVFASPPAPEKPNPATAYSQIQIKSSAQGPDIDLSSVYWLNLRQIDDETSRAKFKKVIGQVQANGRDMLLIPVKKGFKSVRELTTKFFNSMNTDQKVDWKLRRRLRIQKIVI